MNVMVTGAAGYIGSHCVRALLDEGHRVLAVDDLSHGFVEAVDSRAELVVCGIENSAVIEKAIERFGVETVIHFAACIEVGESVAVPDKYYRNNFSNALSLLDSMHRQGVRKIVFSSTAAVYGDLRVPRISESQPRCPINPYGRSKLMVEWALEDYARANRLGFIAFRYFNVAGAHVSGLLGEAHQPETHLLPRILSVAAGQSPEASIFGCDYPTPDGTCIRDYVHVEDLAEAHVLAMGAIRVGKGAFYNLGSECGFSVRQVIDACGEVTGVPIPTKVLARRDGDPAVLVADSSSARNELKWRPIRTQLRRIVTDAWRWHTLHPTGYTKLSAELPAGRISCQ